MPQNKDFALRIELLDECLRNRYRNWTLQDLIDCVNEKLSERYGKMVSRKTIQDAIKFMKEEKMAPIEKKKKGAITYFYYADRDYSIIKLPVKNEEIEYLRDAIGILRQVNDFKIVGEVDVIINKLQHTMNAGAESGHTIIQFEKHTAAVGTEYIDKLFEAIKTKCALRITYQSFKASSPDQYVFHCYLLKEYRNRWFVIGRKEDATSATILALDRIKEIRNSASPFIENDLFNPDSYYSNLVGVSMPDGEQVESIEIRVAANQSPYIRTKPIHHTQKIIKEYKNGDLRITLSLINNYELRQTLLAYGSDIEVVKPESLRNELKDIFEKAVRLYR